MTPTPSAAGATARASGPATDAVVVAAAGVARKGELRGRARQSRSDLHERLGTSGWADRAERLAGTVLRDHDVAAACVDGATVAAFASFADEPPTMVLLDALVAAGARVVLPVVRAERSLAWADYTGPDALAVGTYGIPEPQGALLGTGAGALLDAGVRVILVPALAVDRAGHRVGQGGGFYDVLLAGIPPHAEGGPVRIAVVGADEVLAAGVIPVVAHDATVDRHIAG